VATRAGSLHVYTRNISKTTGEGGRRKQGKERETHGRGGKKGLAVGERRGLRG